MFKKFKRRRVELTSLPQPDDSLAFFESIKEQSEKYWTDTSLDESIYGFQVQKKSAWRKGLSQTEIQEFESRVGFEFPLALRNYYLTMNGLTLPGINVYGNDGHPFSYRPLFYSYAEDLEIIEEMIEMAFSGNSLSRFDCEKLNISKVFPVCGHRFMLIDITGNPILSLCGGDNIYYSDSLSKLLAIEIFSGSIYNVWDFESSPQFEAKINGWLD